MSFGIPVRNGLSIGLLASTFLTSGSGRLVPRLTLNFLTGAPLDSRITFTRSTTATFVGSDGLIQSSAINAPRFDYNPATLAPRGLLIEEQRVNLLLYSEQFDNVLWIKSNATVTANAATSPDGTTNADKLLDSITNTTHAVNQVAVAAAVAGVTYTFSVFIKAAERGFAFVGIIGGALNTPFVSIDLTTGSVAAVNGTVVSSSSTAFGNGWWRVTITATTIAIGNVTPEIRVSANGLWANRVYVGNGTGIFVWGAQLEAGSFATSYIPTVASTVTPAADNATMTGTNFSSWFNASEGTFVASAAVLSTASNRGVYAASDGSDVNELFHYVSTTANNLVTTASVAQANVIISGPVSINTVFSDAFAYRENDISAAFNGVLGTPDTSATLPVVSQLRLGARGDAALRLNGHLRTLTYYATRLTNAQLQALSA